jgi:uncharacterized membrane protein
MTRFELLAMLHGLGVIAWVGGGLALLVLHALAVRADDYDALATAVRQSRMLGAYLYGPASIVTAATGIVLVATEVAFNFSDLWILIGIGGVLLSVPLQVSVADRARARYLALQADKGSDQATLRASARTLTLVSAADIAMLLIVVWAMYAKPGA